ncbi:MAG TPA: magnesium transporter [Firmicutes bacterium]|nr:magnesium transporter [Candidatus Fermentithermobacillaceae bacterium]
MILAHNWAALRKLVSGWRVPDIADLLVQLDKPSRVLLFRCLPRKTAADVFSELEREDTDSLLKELTDEETRLLLAYMRPDDRTELLEELPGQVTQRLLNLLSPEDMKEARSLLGYPPRSTGRLMTPDYVAIRPDWLASRSLEHVRQRGRDSETVDTLYVVDSDWKLLGAVSLRQLILAGPSQAVAGIMTSPAISLSAFDDQEEAARVMDKYDLSVLPVIASEGVMVGIVTSDDIFEVAQEEATEDFHKSAAVTPLKTGYKDASLWLLLRSRLGWLLALIGVDLIAARVMAGYESLISSVVPLVFFLPLIIGCSGNTGSQSSTLAVRDLALGEAKADDWRRLTLKEMVVSAGLGITIALIVWGPAVFQGGTGVGAVVAISAILIVMVGGTVGMATPFLLSKLGFDPATSSTPLITSIADILGVVIYFALASRFLEL